MKRTLTLGFSPCPNDCFIFDALLHGKIDTEGLVFKPVIEDVEALNKKAFKTKLDITKLSFFTYAQVQKKYALLDSGAALGFGVGPLVVSRRKLKIKDLNSPDIRIAIPGTNTTAKLLFSLALPKATSKTPMLFSEIENAVLKGKADAGLIIHESRFTYKQKGLKKVIDLGQWWSDNVRTPSEEKKTKSPIPLGGIAIKKAFPESLRNKVNRVIRRSVEFAFANPDSSKTFIKKHAQEMNDEVIQKHVHLYVNEFTLTLGKQGKNAINALLGLS
jgi:1,4-dihydroxy-6-naphthoate synthase